MSGTLMERCARIDLLVLDVDGVLTDGRIIYSERGDEIKAFHVRDGSGIKLWTAAGKKAAILSGRRSALVARRAEELGITAIVQGAEDKRAGLDELLHSLGIPAERACAIGDDLPDVPVLRACNLAVAVADACVEAQAAAAYVTKACGGHGAVREVIELILRAQGLWQGVIARFQNG